MRMVFKGQRAGQLKKFVKCLPNGTHINLFGYFLHEDHFERCLEKWSSCSELTFYLKF